MNEPQATIKCRGVRTHNLKNIDLDIPLGAWTAVTGVSGSGKSSLAFDTIYAESQRRFLETLGTYERQFLSGIPQGIFNTIEPIPPAVALKQQNSTADPRSVIGTTADIVYPLRLLFGALMDTRCSMCGSSISSDEPAQLVQALKGMPAAGEALLCLHVNDHFHGLTTGAAENKRLQLYLSSLSIEGYSRLYLNGQVRRIEEVTPDELKSCEEFFIVLDRLTPQDEDLTERISTPWDIVWASDRFSALELLMFPSDTDSPKTPKPSQKSFHVKSFCRTCNKPTPPIQIRDLDWQSSVGSCPKCQGLGNVPELDETKIIPKPSLSLRDGAIKPWQTDTFRWAQEALLHICQSEKVRVNVPYSRLTSQELKLLWESEPRPATQKRNPNFVTITQFFGWLEDEKYKKNSRILLAKYRSYRTCPECKGARLGLAGRNAVALGETYEDIFNGEIRQAHKWCQSAHDVLHKRDLVELFETQKEVEKKLELLTALGLGSSALSRRSKSLSGGEYQRVLLSRVLGTGLSDAIYVLDEPSVGLGQNEIPALISCIRELRDLGNTVLMVEHEPSVVNAADHVIELGPGGGPHGGEITKHLGESKPPASLQLNKNLYENRSLLREEVGINNSMSASEGCFRLESFHHLNCENLTVEIPIAALTVIGGPSGSGKSTLLTAGIDAAAEFFFNQTVTRSTKPDVDEKRGMWAHFHVPAHVAEKTQLVSVEQRAMHRSITSVPATLLGIMDDLRKKFASTSHAKELGLEAADFSFNGRGGCKGCGGRGYQKDDLFFLGEVEKECADCGTRRYRNDVLAVQYRGHSIADFLEMSLEQFAQLNLIPAKKGVFELCCELGLGHLPLGVPTSQISGGEGQRLRIVAAVTKSQAKLLCLLDEPSRGLSESDISRLLGALQSLAKKGHTIVVAEHHVAFYEAADQVLMLGPGSGFEGGQIVSRQMVRVNS